MAVGTFTCDISVGKELVCLLVIILRGDLPSQFTLVVEFAEEFCGKLMVCLGCGTGIDIEGDAKLLKRVLDNLMLSIDDILWGDAFFSGSDSNGYTVLIATANEYHFLSL